MMIMVSYANFPIQTIPMLYAHVSAAQQQHATSSGSCCCCYTQRCVDVALVLRCCCGNWSVARHLQRFCLSMPHLRLVKTHVLPSMPSTLSWNRTFPAPYSLGRFACLMRCLKRHLPPNWGSTAAAAWQEQERVKVKWRITVIWWI